MIYDCWFWHRAWSIEHRVKSWKRERFLPRFLTSNLLTFCPLPPIVSRPSSFLFPIFYFLFAKQSRHITLNIHRFFLPGMAALVPHLGNNPGMFVEIVFPVFAPVVHEQIFFFIHQR
jgi:hypothetical protein